MAVQQKPITATPSQYASAAMHLELRHHPIERWDTVRIDSVRYILLTSGTSGRRHFVRADARGCDCIWSQRAATPCSHRLAVELAAIEDELAEASSFSWSGIRAMYPGCAAGCGELATEGRQFCDDCSAARERSQRLAAARARVAAEVTV